MINFQAIRNEIIGSLSSFLEIPVIDGNTVNKKPNYPYGSYVVTTLSSKEFENPREIDFTNTVNTRKEDLTMTISFNFYGLSLDDANLKAFKALEYFEFYETLSESDSKIVVVNTTDVQNRDVLLVDQRERRAGFDVIFRVESVLTKAITNIDDFEYTLTTK